MNSDKYYSLLSSEAVYRLSRIASVFRTRNDGPFRIVNNSLIEVFSDESELLGSIEFVQYINDLYYVRVISSPICLSFDDRYMRELYTSVHLLFWLDDCWDRPRFLQCPVCAECFDLVDQMIDDKQDKYDGQHLINILVEHMKRSHANIELFGLKEENMRVYLKTTLGDFELENFYAY